MVINKALKNVLSMSWDKTHWEAFSFDKSFTVIIIKYYLNYSISPTKTPWRRSFSLVIKPKSPLQNKIEFSDLSSMQLFFWNFLFTLREVGAWFVGYISRAEIIGTHVNQQVGKVKKWLVPHWFPHSLYCQPTREGRIFRTWCIVKKRAEITGRGGLER